MGHNWHETCLKVADERDERHGQNGRIALQGKKKKGTKKDKKGQKDLYSSIKGAVPSKKTSIKKQKLYL